MYIYIYGNMGVYGVNNCRFRVQGYTGLIMLSVLGLRVWGYIVFFGSFRPNNGSPMQRKQENDIQPACLYPKP